MEPVVFNECFGWLHEARGRHGVVLCNPFGYDAYCTHRGWRKLAESVAAAGMPTLRFDYPGTGDSAGLEEDPKRFDAWLGSIAAAVEWLREYTGVEQVSLVGLRLGATLAALAAARIGNIDGLVLLAPVITGRSYLRELRACRRKWCGTLLGMHSESVSDTESCLEVYGFGLHGDDLAQLDAVDLRSDNLSPARRVLLLDSSDRTRSSALAELYASHGVAVTKGQFDEFDRFVNEPHMSCIPTVAFAGVTEWLQASFSSPGKFSNRMKRRERDVTLQLACSQATERAVVFDRYFGVYCDPDKPLHGAPAVLIVNTGGGHHIGDGRFSVLLARRLAALGIASLRMDLGGLGDAMTPVDVITEETMYSKRACNDGEVGADWLVSQGHQRIAALGVCSGAYVSLHISARHPAVVGAYAINLPRIIAYPKPHGFSTPELGLWIEYRRSLLSVRKWLKVLRGETYPLYIAKELSRRLVRHTCLNAIRWAEQLTGRAFADSELRMLLRELRAKQARVRMVYSEFDVGLAEAKARFGSDFSVLRRYPSIRVSIVPKLDHALFARQSRHICMTDVERWLLGDLLYRGASAFEVGQADDSEERQCVADVNERNSRAA
jgi:pimeloyl-ACP methyl ester carboxylesterase